MYYQSTGGILTRAKWKQNQLIQNSLTILGSSEFYWLYRGHQAWNYCLTYQFSPGAKSPKDHPIFLRTFWCCIFIIHDKWQFIWQIFNRTVRRMGHTWVQGTVLIFHVKKKLVILSLCISIIHAIFYHHCSRSFSIQVHWFDQLFQEHKGLEQFFRDILDFNFSVQDYK